MESPETIPVLTELKRPFWELAVQRFLEAKFPEGSVVPHAWFWEAFGLEQPMPDTPMEAAQRQELLYARGMDRLKDALVQDHQIHIRNVFGEGYRVIPPEQQAPTCYDDGMDMVRKGIRHVAKRLANVQTERLTDEQRAEHADYCAKLSRLKQMNRSLRHVKAEQPKQIRSA